MHKQVRSKKRACRYEGQFELGCYRFPVKRRGPLPTFAPPVAARKAANEAASSKVTS